MIKINLLPRTINEKRIVRNTAILFAILVVAVIVAGVTYGSKLRGDVQQMEELANRTVALETQVKGINTKRDEELAKVAPIQQKLDFISSVLDYNTKYPALFEEIAKWTYVKVMYTSLQCDGTQITMKAKVKNLSDLGRYLINMYRATDLFTEVTISGFGSDQQAGGGMMAGPAYDTGGGPQANLAGVDAISSSVQRAPQRFGSGWIDFTVVCKLKTPIVAPVFGGGGAGAAATPGAAPAPAPAVPGPPGAPPPAQ